MDRNYTEKGSVRAISTLQHAGILIRKAQKTYGVPLNKDWSQVYDHFVTYCKKPGPKPLLGIEFEKEIYESVTELQKVGHGLSHKEILQLAEEINSERVTQVLKNTLPSKLEYKSFMMQHNFILRQPESLSLTQSTVATEKNQERIIW